MRTADFDYYLPEKFIAQTPLEPRDSSRLMIVSRSGGPVEHDRFFNLGNYLMEGDLLVCNDSRVIAARLMGKKTGTGGKVEILLLRRVGEGLWEALVKPGRRLCVGDEVEIYSNAVERGDPSDDGQHEDGPQGRVIAEILDRSTDGVRVVRFSDDVAMEKMGLVPLPPYIHAALQNPERYQTVYAREKGSAAAPTAGLHFTPSLIERLGEQGIRFAFGTLHVGLDTFLPIQVEDPHLHYIHREYGELGDEAVAEINKAKSEGRRVVAVGTTSVRLLEAAAIASDKAGQPEKLLPFQGWIDLLILPGHNFRVVDAMITNFHLPRSTLIMLVSAFAGEGTIRQAYLEAIAQEYRFYSFGDAMFIR